MTVRILRGDVRDRLRDLPDESVHCVVTSPPYFGLRDYGHTGQIGLEESPQEFIDELVSVFREVRRVLRADGTAWVNMGDSYASGGRRTRDPGQSKIHPAYDEFADGLRPADPPGVKPKDLLGVPWMLAFALRADGWYLRQDIIWHKPNPMPESVRDRCTKSHEYVFLLAKSERYYYDIDSIMEPATVGDHPRNITGPILSAVPGASPHAGMRKSGNKERKPASARGVPVDTNGSTNGAVAGPVPWEGFERNKRSVWSVTTQPFKEAHFATFPPALIEPCILAGCPVGGTVLDPFGGAGTTGLVADRLQRDAILIELNPEYADMAERRIRGDAPMFAHVANE